MEQVIYKRANGMAAAMGKTFSEKDYVVVFGKELGESTELVEGIESVLKAAADKSNALFCASNGIKAMQINRLRKSGLLCYFKAVYVSDEIGSEKPVRQFFDYCLAASGYSKTDVMMIGDNVSTDIQGSLAAGWRACYLNRNNTSKPVGCLEIHVLEELTCVLRQDFQMS